MTDGERWPTPADPFSREERRRCERPFPTAVQLDYLHDLATGSDWSARFPGFMVLGGLVESLKEHGIVEVHGAMVSLTDRGREFVPRVAHRTEEAAADNGMGC